MVAAVYACKPIGEIDDSQMDLRRVFDESQTNQQSLSCDGVDATVDECKPIAKIDDSKMVGVFAMVAADSISGGGGMAD